MKTRRYTPMLIAAGLLSAMNLGSAFAADAPAGAKPEKMHRNAKTPKRIVTAIEAKTGKPLTPDQIKQLNDATKARQDAIEAANEKYFSDTAAITGLTVDDVREINAPGKRNTEAPKPADAAPAAAPAAPAP